MRQIGAHLGLSTATVSRLLKAPDAPAPAEKGKWDITAVKEFWQARKALDKANPTGTYADELRAKTAAQRAILELELEQKRGNLIVKEEQDIKDREFISIIQSNLLNAKKPLARQVTGKTTPEIEAIIDTYLRDLIRGWANVRGINAAP